MNKQILDLLPVLLLAIVLWLSGLSIVFYRLLVHYRRLGKGIDTGNLTKILEKVLDVEASNKKSIQEIVSAIEEIKKDSLIHIQKLGLVRFNPFNETGGDQSFSLSLLDGKGSGFVISCLHTRDRTRVYAKPVKKGKSNYELSSEEKRAISQAIRGK
jgi:hypothetical protein